MTTDSTTDVTNDPIGELTRGADRLNTAAEHEFPREWVLHRCAVDIAKYGMEDDYIDTTSQEYLRMRRALHALKNDGKWMHPLLHEFLVAIRDVAHQRHLPSRDVRREIIDGEHRYSMIETEALDDRPILVSNAYSNVVYSLEKTLGDPDLARGLQAAFARRIERLRTTHRADHLVFVEKEAGPVGAITMMGSLVENTGLPAAVFRETHWSNPCLLAASLPPEGARVVIVYDLIVSGSALRHVATKLHALRGATTVGAVVLCGYGERRDYLETDAGQRIKLDALSWSDQLVHPDVKALGVEGELRNGSAAHEPALEGPMTSSPDRKVIPPGTYSRETLPAMSAGAQRIQALVQAAAARLPEQSPTATKSANADGHLHIARSDTRGLRYAGKTKPSILSGRPTS